MTHYFDDPRGRASEEFAFTAEQALRRGDTEAARRAFARAAALETEVARSIPRKEPRIRGVIGVSATALWLKAGEPAAARALADELLAAGGLSPATCDELRQLRARTIPRRNATPRLVLEDWNLAAAERILCISALRSTTSLAEAAELLGISQSALKRRLGKYRIKVPATPASRDDRPPRPRHAVA
jgi:hypothetical protein